MCVEVKTIATEDSTHAEIQIAMQHGKFVYLDILIKPELFKVVIPKNTHRVQCVQHCVALSCNSTLYVVADTGVRGILRCGVIVVPESFKIDGIDIRDLTLAEYRSHIGLVLQEPFLFFGTIAENIAYGRPNATRREIVQAARAANAHEFILRLPQGYDSLVGERGQGLSGGERQRISIARALLINPRILIMDEATSSVDTETEQEIQKALDNLVKGRTTIAIAHRLSTLHKADRLVVMEAGQIVEIGKHDELLAQKGAYYRLYEAQARQAQNERVVFESVADVESVGASL